MISSILFMFYFSYLCLFGLCDEAGLNYSIVPYEMNIIVVAIGEWAVLLYDREAQKLCGLYVNAPYMYLGTKYRSYNPG